MNETSVTLSESAIAALAAALIERGAAMRGRRLLVGIAGIPGSGKSTLADRLRQQLGPLGALVPMDGFHLTNATLRQRGLTERKGAPETFDADAFLAILKRFGDATRDGAFPIYDRGVHEPIVPDDPAHRVTDRTRVVLTEGNYLLLDEPPWCELAQLLDETWWLDTSVERARAWLMQRHQAVGRTREEAERRYAVNDGHNVTRVLEHMRPPDRVLRWPEAATRG